MAQALFYSSNAVAMTLAAGILSGDTTCNLSSTSGLPASFPFKLLVGWGTAQQEVVHCTALSGVVATITRGQDGTTAQSHSIGATVVHGVSAREFNDLELHVGSNASVHGVTGSVVGTSDAQALTNKTFDATSNVSGAPLVGTTTVQTLTNKTLSPSINSGPGAVVQGLSGQTGPLLSLRDFNAATKTFLHVDGSLHYGNGTNTINNVAGFFSAGVGMVAIDPGQTPLIIRVNATQSQPVFEVQNSAGNAALAKIDNLGNIFAANLTNAWTAYTPSFTNITSGAGTFAYNLVGKTLNVRGIFSAGTATAAGQVTISLPAGLTSAVAGSSIVPGFIGTANAPWSTTHTTTMTTAGAAFTLGQSLVGLVFTGTIEVA